MTGELVVSRATLEDWRPVEEWAAEEGWNPGRGDADCVHPTDPAGFFLGRVDGRPVSAVSVVRYSAQYAFLGFYLVRPEYRGRGLGRATWREAVPHAGERTIGLDAVPAQEAAYRRSGFTAAHRTVRFGGRPLVAGAVRSGTEVVPVTPDRVGSVAAYDRECFPADREGFVGRWVTAAGHVALAGVRDGRLTGYGVIRKARDGHRVGPLFADTAGDAQALFDALVARAAAGPNGPGAVHIDVPEHHEAAVALATARTLTPSFETVRMYTGPVPSTPAERVYGVTSLELG
jgi:GNAT superfamily N-acetyltransferase